MYIFEFRTGQVSIDYAKCDGCASFACAKACNLYGSGILRIEKGRPVLTIPPEEAKRRCTECLACEAGCHLRGRQAITILLPIMGLKEFKGTVHVDSAE